MDISDYLCQGEINQLNQAFEISLQHDSTLVFWTGISQSLAKEWAQRNDLKTLTMAMGSLYTDDSRKGQKSKIVAKSWSKYMKGASWIFAQHACNDRYAVVLTNAPPHVYSTREDSSYRNIEEPILKGLKADQHTIQIDYVHPTVSGAEGFRYQTWPVNRTSDWLAFLKGISVKDIVNKVRELKYTTAPNHATAKSSYVSRFVADDEDGEQETRREKKAANRLRMEREQQAAQERKADKRLRLEREQQAAQEKKAAKRLKVEREQLMAQEKKAAKRLKVERERQAAQEKKAAKRLRIEKAQQEAQQAAQEKKAAKRLKVEMERQAAQEKKAAKRLKVESERQAAQERKAAKRLNVEREEYRH